MSALAASTPRELHLGFFHHLLQSLEPIEFAAPFFSMLLEPQISRASKQGSRPRDVACSYVGTAVGVSNVLLLCPWTS